ncbi:MAG: helix-turn-helix domain-containing protein [Candidatus Methylacidiphilales bacterium]|nr:helix-turn-helix domain-containing protein [Candidatus Methylacidiphilales bacterium]
MRGFRPLLFSQLDASAGGVRLLRLSVNRHLPAHQEVEAHRHRHAQALLYLTGRGEQEVHGRKHPVAPGTLVLVGPDVPHAFHRTTPRAPLCLVMDYRDPRGETAVVRLPALMMREIRDGLHHLAGLRQNADTAVESAGWALVLLGKLRVLSQNGSRLPPRGGIRARLEKRLAEPGSWALPIAVLARQCGYQQDYLNRKVKEETGLTLNQYRARVRLDRARAVLAAGGRSAAAAEAAGFDDANYFTRWFRQQTGTPPATWRRKVSESGRAAVAAAPRPV